MHLCEQVVSWSKFLLPCILPLTQRRMSSKHKENSERPRSNIATIAHFVQTLVATQCEKHKKGGVLTVSFMRGNMKQGNSGIQSEFLECLLQAVNKDFTSQPLGAPCLDRLVFPWTG